MGLFKKKKKKTALKPNRDTTTVNLPIGLEISKKPNVSHETNKRRKETKHQSNKVCGVRSSSSR